MTHGCQCVTNLLQQKVGYLATIRLATSGELNFKVLSLQERMEAEIDGQSAHASTYIHVHMYMYAVHTNNMHVQYTQRVHSYD